MVVFKHTAEIKRKTENSETDDWSPNNDTGEETIFEEYTCIIREASRASLDDGDFGETTKLNAVMVGEKTDKLKDGDIVNGKYVIVGNPIPHYQYTRAVLRRLR